MTGDRWGVSTSEIWRSYPRDAFVASPTLQAWRGVRIEAPAAAVWPWAAQLRIAPYSYDRVDNLGRRSPRELMGPASRVDRSNAGPDGLVFTAGDQSGHPPPRAD
jgi:hypothetical protein